MCSLLALTPDLAAYSSSLLVSITLADTTPEYPTKRFCVCANHNCRIMSLSCNLRCADRVLISTIVDGCTTRPLFNTSTDPVGSTSGKAIDIPTVAARATLAACQSPQFSPTGSTNLRTQYRSANPTNPLTHSVTAPPPSRSSPAAH